MPLLHRLQKEDRLGATVLSDPHDTLSRVIPTIHPPQGQQLIVSFCPFVSPSETSLSILYVLRCRSWRANTLIAAPPNSESRRNPGEALKDLTLTLHNNNILQNLIIIGIHSQQSLDKDAAWYHRTPL